MLFLWNTAYQIDKQLQLCLLIFFQLKLTIKVEEYEAFLFLNNCVFTIYTSMYSLLLIQSRRGTQGGQTLNASV